MQRVADWYSKFTDLSFGSFDMNRYELRETEAAWETRKILLELGSQCRGNWSPGENA